MPHKSEGLAAARIGRENAKLARQYDARKARARKVLRVMEKKRLTRGKWSNWRCDYAVSAKEDDFAQMQP